MEKITFALESFKNIQELIRFIDQKTGAVLVLASLIFTSYVDFMSDLVFLSPKEMTCLQLLTFIMSLGTLLTLILLVYTSTFKILKPRLAKNYTQNEFSLFYFEHLKELGKINVNLEYANLTVEKMTKDIIDQQHEISVILNKKTNELGKIYNYLFYCFIFFILFILTIKLQ